VFEVTLVSQETELPPQDGLPQVHKTGGVHLLKASSCAVFKCAAVIAAVTAVTAFCVD
jgi:hypothetical protein